MKCHHTIKYLAQRRHHHYWRSYIRKYPRRVYLVRRKSYQMKPLLRFASSTAGSVDRSKLPKISDHLKTTARVKDLVSIVWRLFQERRGSTIQAAKFTIPVDAQNTSDATSTLQPRVDGVKETVLASVQSDKLETRTVSVEAISVENQEGTKPENFQGTLRRDASDACESRAEGPEKADVKIIEAGNTGLRLVTHSLPAYLTNLSFSLPWIGNVKTVPPKKPENEQSKSYSVPAQAEQVVEEVANEQPMPKKVEEKPPLKKKPQFPKGIPKEAIDTRTRHLMRAVATAGSLASRSMRLQEFCKHLCENPVAKSLAVKERAIPLMLRLKVITPDPSIQAHINEALAMLGYVRALPGHGIRILSIDGGGTRGLMAVEILRSLERVTQQPIHHLFDYMCGVSTGAIITLLLGALKAPMDECEELYRNSSTEIFKQSALWGTSNLVLSHAYYDTDTWVKVLKKNIGEMSLIETTRDPTCPKIATVSTIVSETRLQNFIFRNYDYPHRHQSYFLGSYTPRLWEAVRASAAAPGYFQEYKMGKHIHQDGGVMTNNPAALAIHECRHLWPKEKIQCVVSIGNGRFEPHVPLPSKYDSSLKTKILRFVDSATDTEMVHTILSDLLPPNSYFRFNPYLTESVTLDETRPEKFRQLKEDVSMYLRKNEGKLQQAGEVLLEPKTQLQRIRDTIKEKFVTYL